MKLASLLTICVLTLTLTINGFARGSDWPQWRGPDGTGYATDSYPPTEWGESKNIRWKVKVPGSGHASPIVFGDRVYVITAKKTDQVVKPQKEAESSNEDAADTPPARGRRGRGGMRVEKPSNVYQFMVLAYDRKDGREIWRKTVGENVPHEGTHQTASFASNSPMQ